MKLKLREEPKEWIKFVAVWTAFFAGIALLLGIKGKISTQSGSLAIAVCVLVLITAFIRPIWFRPAYRAVMTASFAVGQVMGKVLLTLFYFLALTPMALILRILGKDLLQMKKQPSATYWNPVKSQNRFDRLF